MIRDDLLPQDFRMPAEWEPHEAVWLQWPAESMRSYAGYHLKLESIWLAMTRAMQPHVKVCIVVADDRSRERLDVQLRSFGVAPDNVELHVMPIDDIWARDNGPIFVVDDADRIAVTQWNFNGWGGRAPHAWDAKIPSLVAGILDVPVFTAPLVSEGGAIEVDGKGSFLATMSSILNPNRNPGMDLEDVERVLSEYLGVRHFIWLSGAPPKVCESLGDTTDWHVDIAARFAPDGSILYCSTDDDSDPRFPYLACHRNELEKATDADGRPLELIAMPTPQVFATGAVATWSGEIASGGFTDAAYTNYLVTNGVVLVPVYGRKEDERAKAILAEHFPGREIVGIPTLSLTEEGGAVHCVTQQQPKGRTAEAPLRR
jgi:agmatine deiminase